jgi:hypothetical protein
MMPNQFHQNSKNLSVDPLKIRLRPICINIYINGKLLSSRAIVSICPIKSVHRVKSYWPKTVEVSEYTECILGLGAPYWVTYHWNVLNETFIDSILKTLWANGLNIWMLRDKNVVYLLTCMKFTFNHNFI